MGKSIVLYDSTNSMWMVVPRSDYWGWKQTMSWGMSMRDAVDQANNYEAYHVLSLHICIYIYIYPCMYIYIYIYMYVCMYVYMYIYIIMYIYM